MTEIVITAEQWEAFQNGFNTLLGTLGAGFFVVVALLCFVIGVLLAVIFTDRWFK